MHETEHPITVYVCTTCRPAGDASEPRLGATVHDRLSHAIADRGLGAAITLAPVECLSVCKRPVTIAATGGDRWTYVWGDLGSDADLGLLIDGLLAFRRAGNGIVPWRERPDMMKRGLVARIPPFPGASTAPAVAPPLAPGAESGVSSS